MPFYLMLKRNPSQLRKAAAAVSFLRRLWASVNHSTSVTTNEKWPSAKRKKETHHCVFSAFGGLVGHAGGLRRSEVALPGGDQERDGGGSDLHGLA